MGLDRGYSLVELLVVMAVLSLIAALSLRTYFALKEHEILDSDAVRISAELAEARSLTLSGKDGNQWGVHLASTSVTLFEGASYSSGASGNIVTSLDPSLVISVISLSGGGNDAVFQRLTGNTTENGAVTLTLIASSTESKTITIYGTGLTNVQ